MESFESQFGKTKPEGLEESPFYKQKSEDNQDSLVQSVEKYNVESSLSPEDMKYATEKIDIFYKILDEEINKRGLTVHDDIALFLDGLVNGEPGIKTVDNCSFFHLLRFNLPQIYKCERLDLTDGSIEAFIDNGFRKPEEA